MAQHALPRAVTGEAINFNQSQIRRDLLIRKLGKIGLVLNPIFGYFFLWAPILLLVIFSFNDSRSVGVWRGFTTRWYQNIFQGVMGDEARFSTGLMLDSLQNSIIIALIATLIATSLGTMVALSLVRGNYPGKKLVDSLLYLPVVIPEITQGISLLIFFNVIFDFFRSVTGNGVSIQPGIGTIVIGHVAFNISYVAIVVRARLADMNPRLEEAARDLGANEWRTFWRITFPLILPGVISGALLAFTLSLDDFVITFFTSGVGTTTLPIFVYGLLKLSVTPEINAISTLILIASTLLIGISLALQGRGASSSAV
jgi:spermidine/putrescine transport system permease protein